MSNGNQQEKSFRASTATAPGAVTQITVPELANQLKAEHPDIYQGWTDQQIVDGFISQHPEFRPNVKYELPSLAVGPGKTTIGPYPLALKAKEFAVGAARGTLEALPALTGTAGGILGGALATGAASPFAAPAGAVAGAGLGGAVGRAGQEAIERFLGWPAAPKTLREAGLGVGESTLEQAGWEALGQLPFLHAKPFERPKVAGRELTPKELYKMSRTPGFYLTASEIRGSLPGLLESPISETGMSAKWVIRGYQKSTIEGAEKLSKKLLNDMAVELTPQASGQRVQAAANRAIGGFNREGQIYYEPFRVNGEQISAPTAFNRARAMAKQISIDQRIPLVERPDGSVERLPLGSPGGMVLEEVMNLTKNPAAHNFKAAMNLRDFLSGFVYPGQNKIFVDKDSKAVALKIWGEFGDALSRDAEAFDRLPPSRRGTLGATPVAPQWEAAKTFWKTGRERFDNAFFNQLINKQPEFVAREVPEKSVSDIQNLKKILFGYGTPRERLQARRVWSNFQRSFAEQHIFMDQPQETNFTMDMLGGMKQRLNDHGKDQLEAIYDDPAGKEFLENMRAFAQLMSSAKFRQGLEVGGWKSIFDFVSIAGLGAGHAQYQGISGYGATALIQGVPASLALILRSRPATKIFLRMAAFPGWDRLPQASKTAIGARVVAEIVKSLKRSAPETYGRGTLLGEPLEQPQGGGPQ